MPDTVAGEVLNFIEFLEFRRKPAVFQGQNHYEDHSFLETFYLMQSPANAEWLQKEIFTRSSKRSFAGEIFKAPL